MTASNELIQKMRQQEEPVGFENVLYMRKKKVIEQILEEHDNNTPDEIVHDRYLDEYDFGKQMYYDYKQHPKLEKIATALIANMNVIEEELLNIPSLTSFTKWPEKICKTGWKVFGLYGFGRKLEENTKRCPRTTQLLESLIPKDELTTVGFSSLEPGAYITPHKGYEGYSDNILRLHLGIHVPNPNEKCAIRVGNITKKWHRGQVLIFDDFITHEAWNFSDQIRINLLLDIKYTEKSYMIRNNDIDCHTADFSGGLRNMLSKIDKNK